MLIAKIKKGFCEIIQLLQIWCETGNKRSWTLCIVLLWPNAFFLADTCWRNVLAVLVEAVRHLERKVQPWTMEFMLWWKHAGMWTLFHHILTSILILLLEANIFAKSKFHYNLSHCAINLNVFTEEQMGKVNVRAPSRNQSKVRGEGPMLEVSKQTQPGW